MKKRIKRLFFKFFSRRAFQPFYEKLHLATLRAMNYGAANDPKDSGELFFLEYVKKHLGQQIIIFDIGANVGQFATLANTIFNGGATIYSFEPTGPSFKKLKNKFEGINNVKLFQLGMGDAPGKLELYYDNEGSVLASAFNDNKNSLIKEEVEITTINKFTQENRIGQIDLLKIDVEGYELFVLQGASTLLTEGKVKYIQFEFGNSHVFSRHFLHDFAETLKGYKIYRLLQNGFYPINVNDPRHEIFQTSNYVAFKA